MRLLLSVLFSLLLVVPGLMLAQEMPVELEGHRVEKIQLAPGISETVLLFDNASYDDNYGLLPLFIHRVALPSVSFNLAAWISGEETIDIMTSDRTIADIDKAGASFVVRQQLIHIAGAPFAEVMVLPYRQASGQNIEALTAFTLHYRIEQTQEAGRASSGEFADNSVLAEGDWYRLSTDKTGVHRISYEELANMGINVASIDPRTIRIFGNGNGIVPEKNSDPRIDDLAENAIYVHGEQDGSFDDGDYILFYGQAPTVWSYIPFGGYSIFQHELNPYTDHTFYFLNVGDATGKRIVNADYSGLVPNLFVNSFSDHAVHENDESNILKTGREWYGEKFGEVRVHEYNFHFPNIEQDYPVSLKTNVAAHSTVESNFNYYYGDQNLLEATISKIIIGTTVYAWSVTPDTIGFYPTGDEITIRVEYDRPTSTSLGWMNYIALNARRKLVFTSPQMSFRDHLGFGPGKVAEYTISGMPPGAEVWDVTDPSGISRQAGSMNGGKFIFKAPAEQIREFIVYDGTSFEQCTFVEKVDNQNLHAYPVVDYVILSHPDFMAQAERMLELHHSLDNMTGFIVTPQQVYNEFSSGKQDPSAIRDFMRMLWMRAGEDPDPIYLLLLGDASYDYKDRVPDNTNFVPAYQSEEALKLGYSFVTDDYFGLFDPEEGVNAYGKSVEIGIGRFPVHTVEQAENMVDKVEAYLTMKPDVLANWRNLIGFVADDEDQNLHFTQAEKLQEMIDTGQHQYNTPKVYLDAFPQESSPSGDIYPEVNIAIDNMVKTGCLVLNYTGHGGEAGWAHESVLDIPTINKWDNWNRLPLFITATCEFSRYDDPSMISAGEYVFLNPKGGGIGLLTTSRLAWADPNFRLNKAVYKFMFNKVNGEYYKVGDIVRLSKTDQNNGTNIKNFVLLGDPAMRLAYPDYNVKALRINGQDIGQPTSDTIRAMEEATVSGIITDIGGDKVDGFNGIVQMVMYDKDTEMSTLGNDASSYPANFSVMGQKLAEVKGSVVDGEFELAFFMPQAMATNFGFAKMSFYAYDTLRLDDANGYHRVFTGGTNPDLAPDNQGPDLALYLNNTSFVPGSLTDDSPMFLAYLYDDQGINFTGSGIGRDITLTLDGIPGSAVVLNDIFDPDLDTYRSGWIAYPLNDLADGRHTLTLKAWDNMNNPSEKTIDFVVSVDGQVELTGVYNYPNPFMDDTYFVFEHNKPGNRFDVEIRIFSVDGRVVRTLRSSSPAEGLSIAPIKWDGTDEGGNPLGNGVYIYRMHVTDEQGSTFVQTSRLIYTGRN